jgi:hypothetical protein
MSVDQIVEKLKPFFEKYRTWIIWGGAVLFVSIVIIWATLAARDRASQEPLTLVENPLQNDVSHTVVIGKDKIEEADFPESLEVFNLISRNYHQDIDTLLSRLNRTGYDKTAIQTALYTWAKGESYFEYVPDSQNLYFRFADAVATGIDVRVNSSESAGQYLTEFYKKYFDREYEFLNVQIDSQANRIEIEANRSVNGYPLYIRGHTMYTDHLVIDSNGNLYEGNLLLVEHSTDDSEMVDLVDISNLQAAMSQSDYPKEVFQVYGPSHDHDVEEDLENPQGDTDVFEGEPAVATSSTLENVQIVYYFSDVGFKQLAPTFRIESEGTIRDGGEIVTVPLIIYANALDPARVYVPSE